MKIMTKRVYDPASSSDGERVLVDRLWPRGLSREKAEVGLWMKAIAPSDALRRWYSHDPARWDEFRKRYHDELSGNPGPVEELVERAANDTITLLFAARDEARNNAVALKEYIERLVVQKKR